MDQREYILNHDIEVLHFLHSRYPLYHLSNVFFRDVQYGLRALLEEKGMKAGYARAEELAREYIAHLEKKKILKPLDGQSWVLDYEEFKLPMKKPAPPARPSGSTPPPATQPAAQRGPAPPGTGGKTE